MELNELKSGWQNAGSSQKNSSELERMTKMSQLPAVKRIRRKLIIETIVLTFFLIVYYDWFDGHQKPLYANLLLFSAVLLYIINDVAGYISLTRPVMNNNLRLSLQQLLVRIKRLSVVSLLLSLVYSVCIIVFFTSVISFTREKSFILLGLILVLTQLSLLSYKLWRSWIKKLELQLSDFEGE
ncbi:MAG: hypothetical protein GXC73_19410 [Chitinophagaceae bacterium]|nr:hypothetical protein [Chitinophagaceae bacterium]